MIVDPSLAEFMIRLRRHRLTKEANDRRQEYIIKLRFEKGMISAKAEYESWVKCREYYEPLMDRLEQISDEPEPKPSEPDHETEDGAELSEEDIEALEANAADRIDSDLAGILIISWVFDNIERSNVDVQSAPSMGAYGLWRWARGNKEKFFTSLYPKVIAYQEQVRREEAERVKSLQIKEDPVERKGIEELTSVLEGL